MKKKGPETHNEGNTTLEHFFLLRKYLNVPIVYAGHTEQGRYRDLNEFPFFRFLLGPDPATELTDWN